MAHGLEQRVSSIDFCMKLPAASDGAPGLPDGLPAPRLTLDLRAAIASSQAAADRQWSRGQAAAGARPADSRRINHPTLPPCTITANITIT